MGLSNCQNCGVALDGLGKAGRPKRNCSSKCRELQARKTRAMQPKIRNCQKCNQEFASVNSRNYCTKQCRTDTLKEKSAIKYQIKRQLKYPDGMVMVICKWCNEPRVYELGTSSVTGYHPKCAIDARRARYRIKTVKRQNLITKPSRLSADKVFNLYGPNCAICNLEIDSSLKRTSAMGLTVDHWIPLSKGGSDDITNLRPTHWICNRRKSDSLPKETYV